MKSAFVIIKDKPNPNFFFQFFFKKFKKRSWMMISVLIKLVCLQEVLGVATREVPSMPCMQHFDSWPNGWHEPWPLNYQLLIVAILYLLEVCFSTKKKRPILFHTVIYLVSFSLHFKFKTFSQNRSFLLLLLLA